MLILELENFLFCPYNPLQTLHCSNSPFWPRAPSTTSLLGTVARELWEGTEHAVFVLNCHWEVKLVLAQKMTSPSPLQFSLVTTISNYKYLMRLRGQVWVRCHRAAGLESARLSFIFGIEGLAQGCSLATCTTVVLDVSDKGVVWLNGLHGDWDFFF